MLRHNIKIIAVTSFSMKGDKEKIMAMGADDYTSKPIKPAFSKTFRNLLAGIGVILGILRNTHQFSGYEFWR